MKKIIFSLVSFALVFGLVGIVSAAESWNLQGTYTIDFVCTSGCSGTYTHTMNITSMDLEIGNFSGVGNFHTGTPTWAVSGDVNGSDVSFLVDYDLSSYYVNVIGTIKSDGTMFGTATSSSNQTFTWSTTSGAAIFNRHAEITSPTEAQVVSGFVSFDAMLTDKDNNDSVQWAVREGTCAAGIGTVFGNVDGKSDTYTWDHVNFHASADTSSWTPGNYCFIFNPTESAGDIAIRETREFILKDTVAPLVTIESPSEGDVVSGTVEIYGTVIEDYMLSHYNISVYPGDADFNDFSKRIAQATIYRTTGFSNELIFTWDSTGFEDGEYLIRLAARDAAGNRSYDGEAYLGGDDSQHVITVTVDNVHTKAETLIESGVPGKGLENAPGLQKPFNPKSQAGKHAGKK
jgi:hypothetical protein